MELMDIIKVKSKKLWIEGVSEKAQERPSLDAGQRIERSD
jgi:hypothetical protein